MCIYLNSINSGLKVISYHFDTLDIIELAARYSLEGADELVFLDITASSDGRDISRISRHLDEGPPAGHIPIVRR